MSRSTFPAEQGLMLLFQRSYYNCVLFSVCVEPSFLHFFKMVISLFKMAPLQSVEVLSSVVKHEEGVMFFLEKNICVR